MGHRPGHFDAHTRILLAVRLLTDPTSHSYAAMQGWLRAVSDVERIAYWQRDLEDYRAAVTAKKTSQWTPFPRPWEPTKTAPVMGDDRRKRLRDHARRMTGGRR